MADKSMSEAPHIDGRRIRVLISGPSVADPGGVAALFSNITPLLPAHNLEVDYLEVGSTRGRILHPISDQLAFRSRLNKGAYDVVQVNPSLLARSFVRDGLFAWQARRHGIPTVVFFHGWSHAFAEKISGLWARFFAATYARVAAFIVLASEVEEKLKYWKVAAPVYRSTTAVDDDLLSLVHGASAREHKFPNSPFTLLFLARLDPNKGIYESIDACARLVKRRRNIELIIAGDGPDGPEIRDYAEQRLQGNVRFTGYVKGGEKAALFRSADAFIMPSYAEGMPIAVLEAMSFGLPVITRRVGGLKDILIDGHHGYVTDSKDPAVIAELVDRLILAPDDASTMGQNAATLAARKFTAAAVAERYAEILRKACQSTTASN